MVDNDISFNLTFEDVFCDKLPILDKTETKAKITKLTEEDKQRIAELKRCLESTYNNFSKISDDAYKETYDKVFVDMINNKYYDEVQDFIDIVKFITGINQWTQFMNLVTLFNMYNIYSDDIKKKISNITQDNTYILYKDKDPEEKEILYFYENKRFVVFALLHTLLQNADNDVRKLGMTLLVEYYTNIIKHNDTKNTSKLQTINFAIQDAGGSGHCFYLSIAAQIYKNEAQLTDAYNNLAKQQRIKYIDEFKLYDAFKTLYPHSGNFLKNNFIAQAFVRLEFYIFLSELKNTFNDNEITNATEGTVLFIFKQENLNNIKDGINKLSIDIPGWGVDFHIQYICLLYKKPCIVIPPGDKNFTVYTWKAYNKPSNTEISTVYTDNITNNYNSILTNITNHTFNIIIVAKTDYVKSIIATTTYIILVGGGGHWQWASPNPIT